MIRVRYAVLVWVLGLTLSLGPARATTCGDAYFNEEITWWFNSPLYFSVAGAPASTCGDLWAWRNGSGFNMEAGDWICTDAYGNATKGPWHWSSQSGDELGYAYIDWGTCTSPVPWHIWDVETPVAELTSECGGSFSGTASDSQWGAGFDSDWAACWGEFHDFTDQSWWDPSTGSYSSGTRVLVPCSCNGMPAHNITWSCSTIPQNHLPYHTYVWYAWIWDGGAFAWPFPECIFVVG